MNETVKPVVVVSRCLGLAPCAHDGSQESSPLVAALGTVAEVHAWCPESDAGLGCPRERLRLVEGETGLRLIEDRSGVDRTLVVGNAARSFLEPLPAVDAFVLRHRSATCAPSGVAVYPGPGKAAALRRDGRGVAAGEAVDRHPGALAEDEGRLLNFAIREHFLTAVWALAEFRTRVRPSPRPADLQAFHARYKYVLMACAVAVKDELGRVVANHERLPHGQVLGSYEEGLRRALARKPRAGAHVNVLQHLLGYVSDRLTERERRHLLEAFERYRQGSAPLSAPLAILKSCVIRFDEPYLRESRYFEPYPAVLRNVEDTGKGRRD